MPNISLAGGADNSDGLGSAQALVDAATITLDPTLGNLVTYTPAQAVTINATNVNDGQLLRLVILTSGSSSFVVTFGTKFKTTGTLATGVTTAKTFVMTFVGQGGNLIEVSRTVAM